MPDVKEWMDIKGMKREGHSIREISRRTDSRGPDQLSKRG